MAKAKTAKGEGFTLPEPLPGEAATDYAERCRKIVADHEATLSASGDGEEGGDKLVGITVAVNRTVKHNGTLYGHKTEAGPHFRAERAVFDRLVRLGAAINPDGKFNYNQTLGVGPDFGREGAK